MNRIHVFSHPLTMADDTRLIQLFLDAEHNRRWNRLKNWLPNRDWEVLRNAAIFVGFSAALWYGLVRAVLWAVRGL